MVVEVAVEEAQHGVGHAAVDAVVLLLPPEAGGVVFPRRLQQVECVSTSVWYVTRIQWDVLPWAASCCCRWVSLYAASSSSCLRKPMLPSAKLCIKPRSCAMPGTTSCRALSLTSSSSSSRLCRLPWPPPPPPRRWVLRCAIVSATEGVETNGLRHMVGAVVVVLFLFCVSLNQSINQSTNWGWGSSGCSLLGMSSVALLTTRVLAVVLLLFLLPLLLLLVEATTVTWWSHCACGGRVATLSRLGPLGMTSHPMVLSCFL